MKILEKLREASTLEKSLFYICSLSERVKMSNSVLGGWIDQLENCFALMEMQSDRNATQDRTERYEVTKY